MKYDKMGFWLNVAVGLIVVFCALLFLINGIARDKKVMLAEAGTAMRDITVNKLSQFYGYVSYKVIDTYKLDATKDYADWCARIYKADILGRPEKEKLSNKNLLPFLWPLDKSKERPVKRFTSYFGQRWDPPTRNTGGPKMQKHTGIDMVAKWGVPIYASAEGEVIQAGWFGSYGKRIEILHDHGIQTVYGHCSRIVVRKGQVVEQGEIIGYVGNTGRVFPIPSLRHPQRGSHLHWEIIIDDQPVDVLDFM
jgi:hypothetical protein